MESAAAEFPTLGTQARLVVTDPSALERARAILERELEQIDQAASRFRPDAEIARVNAAGGRRVRISPLLAEALEAAVWAAWLTDGDVDPTVGRALRLAGYDRDFSAVEPWAPALRVHATRVAGWRTIALDRPAGTVRVPSGVELDLGATAKALVADRAAARIAAALDAGALVSLGGDIALAGPVPPGGWPVRIGDDHRHPPDGPGPTISLAGGGLATSSTTTRAWRRGDRWLHHLIDPRTGHRTRSPWRTVSVAAASCLEANVAATAAIVRGERAIRWLDDAGLPARLVATGGAVVHLGAWPAEGDR